MINCVVAEGLPLAFVGLLPVQSETWWRGWYKAKEKEKKGKKPEPARGFSIKKNPKPVKGMSLGGLGWAYECKDGASPLRPMTRGEAAVVLVKTLNPKP